MKSRLSAIAAACLLLPLLALAALGSGVVQNAPAAAATTTSATTTATTTATVPPPVPAPAKTGYWLVASDGGLFAFGGAPFDGSMGGQHLNKPVVGMAGFATTQGTTPVEKGYWEVASDGGIFAFGTAPFYGSMGGQHLNKPIVGMAALPTGGGYWMVASDGGIFAFGKAQFYGSMGGQFLAKPIVGMAAAPTGGGYWLVASDGGIFAFGSAQFHGSMGGKFLAKPIVGMAAAPTGHGYWEVATDGGMFAFGSATFKGSLGNVPQSRPIIGMSAIFASGGYWLTNNNGQVTNFGTAKFWGSAPQVLNAPIVGITTAVGNGDPGNTAFQSGAYGYDLSGWNCTPLPPAPHQIGVVQVNGWSGGKAPNGCLKTEATWAGGGLSLYTFLTYGTAPTSPDGACAQTAAPTACNYGYVSAIDAFTLAKADGLNTAVPWWLDIERGGSPTYWSSTVHANAAVIQGALDGLRSEGINNVGFYFSASMWQNIAGTYNPPGPLWIAWYEVTPTYTCTQGRAYWAAQGDVWPSGPVDLVQYSSPTYSYPAGDLTAKKYDNDYAC